MRTQAIADCLAACPHEAATARRLTAPRSCSAPKSRCSCRSPRAAGRCAQRGRNRRGLHCCRATEWWRRRGRTAFVQTSQDPLQVPLIASGGAMRTKRGHRRGFSVGPPKGGGVEAGSTALVQRSQEPLQLPFTERGGAVRTKRPSPEAALQLRRSRRRREDRRLHARSAPKSRRSCRSPRAEGRCAPEVTLAVG
jgi:hypothetical protein